MKVGEETKLLKFSLRFPRAKYYGILTKQAACAIIHLDH